MEIDLTIKNYCCFPDETPASFTIRPGFTAFVGPNNAGKSALLKFFYLFREKLLWLATPDATPRAKSKNPDLSAAYEYICNNTNDRDLSFTLKVRSESRDPMEDTISIQRDSLFKKNGPVFTFSDGQNPWSQPDMKLLQDAAAILADNLYVGAFRSIDVTGTTNCDLTIGAEFIAQWQDFQSGKDRKKNKQAQDLEAVIANLLDLRSLRITPAADSRSLQFMINGNSYRHNELGTGISQIVIVLVHAAIRRPQLILIDEPELNLHPALQLEFLTQLGSFAEYGVLFATHNLGLARSVADNIYSVRINADGNSAVSPFEGTPNCAEFLGEMNYGAYRDLGFEKILLVEGSSDIKTVKQLLGIYGKQREIVTIHLGGAALITGGREHELEEIKRISTDIHAVIDSEKASEDPPLTKEREAFCKTCKELKIDCCVLKKRAIENYFPERAIREVKGEKYSALEPYQALKDADPSWGKQENWRIARKMNKKDLADTDLGNFLANL